MRVRRVRVSRVRVSRVRVRKVRVARVRVEVRVVGAYELNTDVINRLREGSGLDGNHHMDGWSGSA